MCSLPSGHPGPCLEGGFAVRLVGLGTSRLHGEADSETRRGFREGPFRVVHVDSKDGATLDFSGDGFLQVAVPTQSGDSRALVTNSGTITANGGSVTLNAATAREAARNAINMSGTIEARSCERFRLLSDALAVRSDPLAGFYDELFACEARHYTTMVDLAVAVRGDEHAVRARLADLACAEAVIAAHLGVNAAIHG